MRVRALAAHQAQPRRPLAAEGDRLIAQAQRELAPQLLHHAAGGIKNRLPHRIFFLGRRIDGFRQTPAQRLRLLDGNAQFAADRLLELHAADVDLLQKADVSTLADDHLGAGQADIHQHVHFLLILAAAGEALDAAEEGAGLNVQRGYHDAAGVQLLDEAVDILIARCQDDHFLQDVISLPHLAGRQRVDLCILSVKRKDITGLKAHRRVQLLLGHQRQAQILDVQKLAGQRGDDVAAQEWILPKHLPQHLRQGRHSTCRLELGFRGKFLQRPGHRRQRIAHHLELKHLDRIATNIQSNGLNLGSCQSEHFLPNSHNCRDTCWQQVSIELTRGLRRSGRCRARYRS